ncbi:MAG: hypothetical protein IBX53_03400 [Halomonas sp.]|uniref:hypothetical protein n=1 Tax=Halomonas sp. TaxID=1486246 RepID=UPI001A0A69E7|nr:hypothetical protein [Halomonas sp.]MBE0488102.1 hypothetical protein [Halomonas sp.]
MVGHHPYLPLTLRLGTTQTLAWASSYYLPAILAVPMARGLGLSSASVFAAFSLALVISAVLGPFVGRCIDRRGGRDMLVVSNLVLAAAPGRPHRDAGGQRRRGSACARRVRLTMVLLAYVFAAGWFVPTAMAAHLPRLLQETGVSLPVAVAAAPLLFGLLLEANGAGVLWLTSGLMLGACLALLAIRRPA